MNQTEINRLLKGLLDGGYIYEKKVGQVNSSSGAIYLPKKFIGKFFRVILIPMKQELVEKVPEPKEKVKEDKWADLKEESESVPPEKKQTAPSVDGRVKIDTTLKERPE